MRNRNGQTNSLTLTTDKKRQGTQCERIIDALQRGPLFNVELIHYGLSYTRRIKDLREQGWNISCTRLNDGLTEYRLELSREAAQ